MDIEIKLVRLPTVTFLRAPKVLKGCDPQGGSITQRGVTDRVSSEEADLFPRIGKADSEETNVENVPNRFAVLNVLLQSPLPDKN